MLCVSILFIYFLGGFCKKAGCKKKIKALPETGVSAILWRFCHIS